MGCLSCVDMEKPGLYKPYEPCQLSHGSPCLECCKVMALRSQIIDAQKALDELLEQHRQLRTQINRIHDPIILRLSPEISSSIFQFCVRSEALELESKYDKFQKIVSGPLTLGAVCRDWRRIAFSTPQLWTFIRVRLGPRNLSWQIDLLRDWLYRSGCLPLTVHAYYQRSKSFFVTPPPPRDVPNENDLQLINVVNQHSNRWKRVQLQFPSYFFSLFNGNSSEITVLDSLTLNPGKPDGQFGISNSLPTPIRVDISLFRFNAVAIGWGRVTHATVKDLQLDEWLELFKQAPNLVECTIGPISQGGEEYYRLPSQPVVHKQLQTLCFSGSGMTAQFFDRVKLPALQKLHLTLRALPTESIVSMIRRSSCNLHILCLISEHLENEEAIMPLLREISSLVRFDLEVVGLSQEFSIALLDLLNKTSISSDNEPRFLPKLRHFTYYPEYRFPWYLLAPIFGPLSELSNPGRRPLESVHIYFTDMDPTFLSVLEPEAREEYADPIIDEESIPALLAITRAGLDLQIGYPEGSLELIKWSMEKHGMTDLI